METTWFILLSLMLIVYVVLDGFDFGAGVLHLFVARTDDERRTVLQAIGPVWHGNEVWLLAGGGVLVLAFPKAYSAGFGGFYLPLMMALWLLVMRGIAIKMRSDLPHPLWRSFWDGAFFLSSTLMTIVLGAALGNVLRGVPLDGSGFFAGPLFTNFMLGPRPGVLDWYTVLVGVFTLCCIAGHGALYLVAKTTGPVQQRSRTLAGLLWTAALPLGVGATIATAQVQPRLYANLLARPWTWLLLAGILAGLLLLFTSHRRGREWPAFLGSCVFLVSMLFATAAGLYPYLLFSTLGSQYDMHVQDAASGSTALRLGLAWWIPAFLLGLGYLTYLFRTFAGKVTLSGEEGY
jgi:cytochrome d ubiquinol oxidase subunit II